MSGAFRRLWRGEISPPAPPISRVTPSGLRHQWTNWSRRPQCRATQDSSSSVAARSARSRPKPSLASYAAAMRSPSVITIFSEGLGAAERGVFMSRPQATEMPGHAECACHAFPGGWASHACTRAFARSHRTFNKGRSCTRHPTSEPMSGDSANLCCLRSHWARWPGSKRTASLTVATDPFGPHERRKRSPPISRTFTSSEGSPLSLHPAGNRSSYSVVLPSKCSSSASAAALVWWTTPSR